jgi:hypothetical protein
MPETKIQVAAMLGIEPDPPNNLLRLRFKDKEDNVYALDLGVSILGGLIAGLMGVLGHLRGTGIAQPMTLNSGRPFVLADGRAGLEMTLESVLRLPVLFPREAIPALRKTLDELERRSIPTPPPSRN